MSDVILRQGGSGLIAQGSAKDAVEAPEGSYHVIVLCAEEWQPNPQVWRPKGVTVVYAPNDDSDKITRDQLDTVRDAARIVVDAYRKGLRVLVTCMQGRNRSGLVTAIALHTILGVSGARAVEIVRNRRRGAVAVLSNPLFVRILNRLEARKRLESRGEV